MVEWEELFGNFSFYFFFLIILIGKKKEKRKEKLKNGMAIKQEITEKKTKNSRKYWICGQK